MKCWLLFVDSVHIQNEYMDWIQMCFRHVLFLPFRSSLFRRQKLSFSPTGTAVATRNSVLPQRDRAKRCVSGNLCQLLHNYRNKLFNKSRTNRSDGARASSRPMGILHTWKSSHSHCHLYSSLPIPIFWHVYVPIPMGFPCESHMEGNPWDSLAPVYCVAVPSLLILTLTYMTLTVYPRRATVMAYTHAINKLGGQLSQKLQSDKCQLSPTNPRDGTVL